MAGRACQPQHVIAWRGHAPLNYARFLDYAATELNFLQKVGGGYVFVHRYLLEHFAEIAVARGFVAGGMADDAGDPPRAEATGLSSDAP